MSPFIAHLIDCCEFDLSASEEIEFIASGLYELESSSLSKARLNEIEAIISHPSLRINSELLLHKLVISRMCEDLAFSSLFQLGRAEHLLLTTILNFSLFVSE
jgi:hypothetical protein